MITANVIYRVFRLKVGPETGTGFTIEEEGREYLVTARHLAHSLWGKRQVEVFKDGGWSPLEVTRYSLLQGRLTFRCLRLPNV